MVVLFVSFATQADSYAPSGSFDESEGIEEETPSPPTPFDRGRFSLHFGGGTQSSFNSNYVVISGQLGFFALPGLELGIGATQWFGSGPNVSKVSPRITYFAYRVPSSFQPYVGVLYDHWFIGDGFEDLDLVGVRVGLVRRIQTNILFTVGLRYESVISDCSQDCSDIQPEVSIALSF